MNTCNTCGKLAHSPYRRIVNGKYIEGCVDDFHSGHLVPMSESHHWHERKEAKKIRRDAKNRLKLFK